MLINKILNVGIIVSLTVAGVNLYRYLQERDDGKSIVSCSLPTGNFEIIPRDGRLNAVNTETGMTLGVPERSRDGRVLLVTNGGRVRDVTECLGEKKGWFAPRWPDAENKRPGGISQ
ncbi:hypothetical protein R0U04_003908 [Salmonella enterica]|uniref:hypothetical protein n=1 Tax=Salmonella enterica TaxID=28901 RepID=UPI000D57FF39|nr:hypothetical protein [Salmonella enterica]PVQ03146.1 hypothetical protein C4707_19570 [Salmonella enterica subsp. enterica serovar Newport]EBB7382061.1 hypothetical protein [Salmonella enterica]EBI3269916.1 hypothetical protein [Salmonella enterica]EBI7743515.1 hypothetical protein [Salmonella enterica]EBL8960530.1 hypothetical protein [Salmonella enterica]